MMHKFINQRVPPAEHPNVKTVEKVSWDYVRVFLTATRHGSFRGASGELGMALNTVRRHIETLEHELGCLLMLRNTKGIQLTQEGEKLLAVARQMEKAAFGIQHISQADQSALEGRVRISVTEGLGAFWVTPSMVDFQRQHQNIVVELNCTMRVANLLDMDADIAIQLVRPENPDLKVVKLGRMHVMPFASQAYLKAHGRPASIEELENHKIIEQLSPQLDIDAVDRIFPDVPREGFVAVSTNTSTAHYHALLAGAGLGMLPTYMATLDDRLVAVDLELHVQHDIWLSYHPEIDKISRVRAAIDWLRKSFDPEKHPFFRDEFIHPNDL